MTGFAAAVVPFEQTEPQPKTIGKLVFCSARPLQDTRFAPSLYMGDERQFLPHLRLWAKLRVSEI